MATLYAVSQSVNGRVANTCNLSEDYVGYSRKTPSGYAGEAGLLQRYAEFTERYMDVASDGGSDHSRKMYARSKTEIEYHITKVEKALAGF